MLLPRVIHERIPLREWLGHMSLFHANVQIRNDSARTLYITMLLVTVVDDNDNEEEETDESDPYEDTFESSLATNKDTTTHTTRSMLAIINTSGVRACVHHHEKTYTCVEYTSRLRCSAAVGPG